MSDVYVRVGELADIRCYPHWMQEVAQCCSEARGRVARHEFFCLMRDAALEPSQAGTFLVGVWPLIEQFPQYMALNLLKVQLGRIRGHEQARRYLIRNIRVEQNHADHWLAWANACGVSRADLIDADVLPEISSLSHWCWNTCDRDPLAVAMAATNYAIEGVTGDWSALVCSSDLYEHSFSSEVRPRAMRWLKLHARYDDTHPWEALEIICTIMGVDPPRRSIELIMSRVMTSYDYMRLTLDHCLDATGGRARLPVARPVVRLNVYE